MNLFNNPAEMTFEVTVRGKEYDSVLRSFYADGKDFVLREQQPFPEDGFADGPKEELLRRIWNEDLLFWVLAARSDSAKNTENKEIFTALAETLEKLDYSAVKKELIR